jgi:hypothetical protein
VFFGVTFWTVTRPVIAVLQKLLKEADFAKYVKATDSPEEACDFIKQFKPEAPPAPAVLAFR